MRCKQRTVILYTHYSMIDSFDFCTFYNNFRMFIDDCNLNKIILALNEFNIMYFIVNMFIEVTYCVVIETCLPKNFRDP